MTKVVEAKALDNYRLWVKFSDGVTGIVDLSDLVGKGVFVAWKEYERFLKVRVGPHGEVLWDDEGEIDLCPDALYMKVTGEKPEDPFPKLKDTSLQHA